MSDDLYEILASFSVLSFCVAIAVAGLACHRLRKRGADRAFGAAAWLAFGYLLLTTIPYPVDYAMQFANEAPLGVLTALRYTHDVASAFLFGHYLIVAVAVVRTALRLPPSPVPAKERETEGAG